MLLDELIGRARQEGKWLWCRYHGLWFSPDQLEAENAAGRFRWGPESWKLRDPKEYLTEAEALVSAALAQAV